MNRHTARPRWLMPWLARLGLAAFASWWLALFGSSGFSPSVFLLFAMLPLTVASLFLVSWWLSSPEHRAGGG